MDVVEPALLYVSVTIGGIGAAVVLVVSRDGVVGRGM